MKRYLESVGVLLAGSIGYAAPFTVTNTNESRAGNFGGPAAHANTPAGADTVDC